jgi:hypothetical protein
LNVPGDICPARRATPPGLSHEGRTTLGAIDVLPDRHGPRL